MNERVVCTIITKSYLQYARALATSLTEYNPTSKLLVLLADRVDGYFDPEVEPFELIRLEDLPDQDTIEKMCFYYTPYELCCALRGALHEYIFDKTSIESWIFLDSDVMIFGSLDSIFQELGETSILLNPHSSTPIASKYLYSHEINFLKGGVYNAGFLGLRRTEEAKLFASWFRERLTQFCFSESTVDQIWLNLVPCYFRNASLLLHPGANLAHWNLISRTLEKDSSGAILVDKEPLLFVHFSGWEISNPAKISKHAPTLDEEKFPFWADLANSYRAKLLTHGYETVRHFPYAFSHFQTGEIITPAMRRIYFNHLAQKTKFTGSPFKDFLYFQSEVNPNIGKLIKKMVHYTRNLLRRA